ncbi:glycerophosphodiester phosphodiesterase family protein [Neorhizobium galegae]|jgi:glycerophosphoryl diester phosphodiesterase|uniref:glycerophosphodiester phosphodiesterase family protein n=1 Tax=Neorhizobium galegae TaxID=399 RepID=UPI002030061C|nr:MULTISPECIES: glycerophosphodiester phosphodiesterase family protein [Neorhizobium]MCQ1833338.1 glycerophosphodiester phosphodiesterase [Neorhizobium galegae]UIY30725.1 glycerophosphodiester phosphodiesterase [Neorhizobium galegae]
MKWKIAAAVPLVIAAALWVGNTSLFSSFPSDKPLRIIAHRGQHQLFDATNVKNDTCTASLMLPPTHGFLENTIPGMKAAFDAGADVVELDVHLTPDKQFAVFHDWTLDCRTEAKGVTEQTPMPVLKTLDIGHGYTADGGRTFPFRGQSKGQMPTLPEVFAALPDGRFLINFKSRRAEEGEALAALLNSQPPARAATFGVYGGNEPTEKAVGSVADLPGYSNRTAKSCLLNYLALGWSGHVPEVCRNTLVPVPANLAFLLWGWPQRFYNRMQAVGSDVVLIGPFEAGDAGSSGIDDRDTWDMVPSGFPGLVWTNVIEKVRPEMERRGFCTLPSRPHICG